MNVISIVAGLIVVSLLVLFVPYLMAVWQLPTGRRPLTTEYDRFGHPIGLEENPDYTEAEPDEERELGHALESGREQEREVED